MVDEMMDDRVVVDEHEIIDKADTIKFFAGKLYGYIDALKMNNNIDDEIRDYLVRNIDPIVYVANKMYGLVYEEWTGELD